MGHEKQLTNKHIPEGGYGSPEVEDEIPDPTAVTAEGSEVGSEAEAEVEGGTSVPSA